MEKPESMRETSDSRSRLKVKVFIFVEIIFENVVEKKIFVGFKLSGNMIDVRLVNKVIEVQSTRIVKEAGQFYVLVISYDRLALNFGSKINPISNLSKPQQTQDGSIIKACCSAALFTQ